MRATEKRGQTRISCRDTAVKYRCARKFESDPSFRQRGFTLVELIIVIVISGILAGALTNFIVLPIQGYTDMARRATLVNAADNALQRMARDVHQALPNSIRTNGTALEIINVVDGGRYRNDPPPGSDLTKLLEFTTADTEFNLLGQFLSITRPYYSASNRLVIYNVGVPGANAYEGTNVISSPGISIATDTDPTEDHITLDSGVMFSYPSPTQRIYMVDTPISYQCVGNNLTRYTGYPLQPSPQPTSFTTAGALVTDQVSACTFTYQPGTPQRAGLLTLTLTLTDTSGETIRLLRQVHVDNTP